MPRTAILSDIHGNLEAFEAVLQAIENDGIELTVHLGDLVGYNANPRQCLHLARRREIISILGNHDLAILDPRFAEGFNLLALQALHYCERQLEDDDRSYLRGLDHTGTLLDKWFLCHGSPEHVGSYILHVFQAKRAFNFLVKKHSSISICFFGHTHMQRLWVRDERGKVFAPDMGNGVITFEDGRSYLANPGSVGQPRQGDNRAHYLIFDTDARTIHFRAVPYDIRKAQRKILEAGLPSYLAERLEGGF
jgi:predicted phosphodiesterase